MGKRIDRILNQTHIARALGRRGWLALIAIAAPMLYMAAEVELAPAQTLMQVAPPLTPQPPALVAQAAPSPATPADPRPPATQIEQAPPAGPQRSESPNGLQQFLMQQMVAYSIPDGLWSSDNLFSQDRARAQQLPETPSQGNPDTRISFSVADTRDVKLSIPLGDSIEHHVLIEIYDRDGRRVRAGEHRVVGTRWDLTVELKPGSYHLRAVIKKAADGSMVARGFDFDVN